MLVPASEAAPVRTHRSSPGEGKACSMPPRQSTRKSQNPAPDPTRASVLLPTPFGAVQRSAYGWRRMRMTLASLTRAASAVVPP
jgi:hypothetical protein